MKGGLEVYLFNASTNSDPCGDAYRRLFRASRAIANAFSSVIDADSRLEANIVVADGRVIRGMNKRFRGIDLSTDVLSFPMGSPFLGEVWISPADVRRNADEYRVDSDEELVRVVVHGLLHLLGRDHTKPFTRDSKNIEPMYVEQEQIISKILEK